MQQKPKASTDKQRQETQKHTHTHTPSPCVCLSSDTGQWPWSRSSWYSREGWTGQRRRNPADRCHTWHQQHSSTNMAATTEEPGEGVREQEMTLTKLRKKGSSSSKERKKKKAHLAEAPPCVRVTHLRCNTTLITLTGETVGETVETSSTAVTLAATDPRFAAAENHRSWAENRFHQFLKCIYT